MPDHTNTGDHLHDPDTRSGYSFPPLGLLDDGPCVEGRPHLRTLLLSSAMSEAKAPLSVALGIDDQGEAVVDDLSRLPHLLIGGMPDHGVTECVDGIISSLIFRLSPREVRFIIIDVEHDTLHIYNTLPHLLIPVVQDPIQAYGALSWLLYEAENRKRRFQDLGTNSIAELKRRGKDDDE